MADADEHDKLMNRITAISDERSALRFWAAQHNAQALRARITDLTAKEKDLRLRIADLKAAETRLRNRAEALRRERSGHGGDRIAELERLLAEEGARRSARQSKADRFQQLLDQAGLPRVATAAQFAARREELTEPRAKADAALADAQNRFTDVEIERREADVRAAELNAELLSLRARRTNIPRHRLRLDHRSPPERRQAAGLTSRIAVGCFRSFGALSCDRASRRRRRACRINCGDFNTGDHLHALGFPR